MSTHHTIKLQTLAAIEELRNPDPPELAVKMRCNIDTTRSRLKNLAMLGLVDAKGITFKQFRYTVTKEGSDALRSGVIVSPPRPNQRMVQAEVLRPKTVYNASHLMPCVQSAMKHQPNSVFDYARRIAV